MAEVPDSDKAWPWVRYFLDHHLPVHRGVSPNTLASYRVAFRQLRRYLYQRLGQRSTREFPLDALEPQLVLEFLAWLQSAEGGRVGTATRNARLAALRSFFRFLQLYCPASERSRWERLRHLPEKRTPRPTAQHLEVHEVNQVFAEVDISRPEGLRDLALLALLYNTGARASEVAGLRRRDLCFGDFPMVRFKVKGGREHRCPLWPVTASILKRYMAENGPTSGPMFLNQRGGALTRHGIARRVDRYLSQAARAVPSIGSKRLSTHSFRHTTAVHLLQNGAEMHVIKAWLGHRSTRSTDHYLDLNLQNQRALLERFAPPVPLQQLTDQPQNLNDWLEDL